MKTLLPCGLLSAMVLLAACGNEPAASRQNATPSSDTSRAAAPARDPRTLLYLDDLYATSTAPGKDVLRLFDDDPATDWQTRPGAGPDEGLMLYFSPATAQTIKFIETAPAAGAAAGGAVRLRFYVNGQPDAEGAPGERITLLEKASPVKVNSLYVRFLTTGRETTTTRTADDTQIAIESVPANVYMGLQKLQLFNERGEALHLVPPQYRPGQVTASSTLLPASAYGADNLFDSRKEFVWVEGNAATAGEGEMLTFRFHQPVRITALQIWNGYQRSTEHYRANARVRNFSFGAPGGPVGNYTLRDDAAGQKIELPVAATGNVFELKISSIFPGKKYRDLAISNLLFYDGDQPFLLAPSPPPPSPGGNAQTTASPLATLLDRRVYNTLKTPFDQTAQSLILRSDGTFVLYSETAAGDEAGQPYSAQNIADGNWELVSASGGQAQVKVFGKWFDYSEVLEYYKGSTQQEATKIFSDVLTIDAATIQGTKMIGTFYRK